MSFKVEPKAPSNVRSVSVSTGVDMTKNIPSHAPEVVEEEKAVDTSSPAVETAPPAAEKAAPEVDPRIAELERREIAIRQQTLEMQRLKQEMEEAKRSQEGRLSPEEWKQKFLEDPTQLGIDYQDMADRYLSQPSEEKKMITSLQREIEDLRSQYKNQMTQLEQAQKQAYENAVRQLQSETESLIASRASEYEAITSLGRQQDVVNLIKDTYQKEQIMMSVEQAANQIEQKLIDEALRYAGLSKVKAKIVPTSDPAKQEDTKEQKQTQNTLTRSLSQASGPLTPSQLRERAIAAFNGSLK